MAAAAPWDLYNLILSLRRALCFPPQETLSHEMRGLEKGVRGSVLGVFPFLSERVSDPRSR